MASSSENISMAVFCDFENVALGVRDANYEKFDIKLVLERLLLKGSIVVKKAYCDWDRYKSFKGTMHEANFELIEIPHVRQSGKNSADIRMVVDALDLCYTKAHVDTFVIVSGDSDFSPLVSKLRENAKRVIGVGVKQSTSDLLVANCDEFIFYDDLVREVRRAAAKRDERKAQPQAQAPQQGRRPSDESNRKKEEMEARKLQALEMVVETFDALVSERGDTGKIWASLLKDTLKRRRPDFSETYFGFRTFGNLLEEAQTRGLFEFGRDEKSGTYVYRSAATQPAETLAGVDAEQAEPTAPEAADGALNGIGGGNGNGNSSGELPLEQAVAEAPASNGAASGGRELRRRGGRGRKGGREQQPIQQAGEDAAAVPATADADSASATWPAPTPDLAEAPPVELSPIAALADAALAASAAAVTTAADAADAPAADVADVPSAAAAADVAADAAAEPAPPVKERRRTPRKPAARKASAAPVEEAAAPVEAAADTPAEATAATAETAPDDAAVALDAAAAVEAAGTATAEDIAAEDIAADGEDAQGDKPARKKQTRAAYKAPSRKAAPRARRPAKPKTPVEG
ncbi:NYN domain-containing protein [Massilia phyllosphaerae]|uniref:NYN domain-containing protein n=1 Tax=Massilia phyllosphaerae TaxID=3106034 RepID=UPI002B1CDB66|nr:NYN domain-containing protein [Massilia sp. SGZ-792]